jgi:hypothetical protein
MLCAFMRYRRCNVQAHTGHLPLRIFSSNVKDQQSYKFQADTVPMLFAESLLPQIRNNCPHMERTLQDQWRYKT